MPPVYSLPKLDWVFMDIRVIPSPQKHLIIDHFLSPSEESAVLDEIQALEPHLSAGTVLRDTQAVQSDYTKRNRNLWLEEHYPDRKASPMLNAFREKLFSPPVLEAFATLNDLLFENATYANRQATLLSAYGHGDFYAEHADEFPSITANLFVCRTPKAFEGGDFHLADTSALQPHRAPSFTRVEFVSGRLVLFPARARHFVDAVRMDSSDFMDRRFSVQHWLTYVAAG